MKFTQIGIAFLIGMIAMFLLLQKCETGKKVYIEKKGVPVIVDKKDTTTHFEKEVKPKPKKTFKVAKKAKETPNIEVINLDTLASIPDSAIINVYSDTTQIGRAKFIQNITVDGIVLNSQNGCIGCFDTTFVYVTDTIIYPCKPKLKDLGLAFGAGYLLGIITGLFVAK